MREIHTRGRWKARPGGGGGGCHAQVPQRKKTNIRKRKKRGSLGGLGSHDKNRSSLGN